jgi:AAA15 family ATPase/GTPase
MAFEHIKSLAIVNFKCFKHLSIAGIGKVNLIGGKNNVGKTAFLEAVELLVYPNKYDDLGLLIKKF